jgi:hypothetical protein
MVFGQKTPHHGHNAFGHKLADTSNAFGHKHHHKKHHAQPQKGHDVKATKVINHETGGAYDIRHKYADNTHSTQKQNSAHYSSDLERAPRKERNEEGSNFM